jgi:hypothetical protein
VILTVSRQNTKAEHKADFVILTREPAMNIGRKYFWNKEQIELSDFSAEHEF